MPTYRMSYTIEIHSTVDVDSPTEEDAQRFFWEHVTRQEPWRLGHVQLRDITPR